MGGGKGGGEVILKVHTSKGMPEAAVECGLGACGRVPEGEDGLEHAQRLSLTHPLRGRRGRVRWMDGRMDRETDLAPSGGAAAPGAAEREDDRRGGGGGVLPGASERRERRDAAAWTLRAEEGFLCGGRGRGGARSGRIAWELALACVPEGAQGHGGLPDGVRMVRSASVRRRTRVEVAHAALKGFDEKADTSGPAALAEGGEPVSPGGHRWTNAHGRPSATRSRHPTTPQAERAPERARLHASLRRPGKERASDFFTA